MFGSDYFLGYSQGRSSAEYERETNTLVSQVIYGQRRVTVDQTYLDQLRHLVEKFRSDSDYNFHKVEQFYAEAVAWKDTALRFEAEAKAGSFRRAGRRRTLAYRAAMAQTSKYSWLR